jgi:prevent-host-death family protein
MMLTTISVSELRTRIRHVLNEVIYHQTEYIIEKFGEPAAAIISIEDYRLLQTTKLHQGNSIVQEVATSTEIRR